jgi:glutamate dehydrogenase/leucine dehydrogenase
MTGTPLTVVVPRFVTGPATWRSAPDSVINAGGVLHAWSTESLNKEAVSSRLEGIAAALREVFAYADRANITTAAAAEQLARTRLSAASH